MNQVYSEAGIARWKFRPKFHYFEEMMIQMRRTRVNPRHLACWVDEGYLGHIKKIAIHTHANTALLRIFQRLMINLSQRFHNTKELAKEVERLGVLKKEPPKKYDHLPLWIGGPWQKSPKPKGRARWACGVGHRTGTNKETLLFKYIWPPKTMSNKTFGSRFFYWYPKTISIKTFGGTTFLGFWPPQIQVPIKPLVVQFFFHVPTWTV